MRELGLSSPSERHIKPFNKIIDLLNMVEGITIHEPERKDECCGFGGMFSIEEPAVSTRMGEDKIKRHMATGAEYVTGPDSSCLMHMAGIAKKREYADQVYSCCSNISCRTMSTEHSKRAAKFTQNVEKTTWHDATFWSVRQKRDKMAQELPEGGKISASMRLKSRCTRLPILPIISICFPRIWRAAG